MRVIGGLLCLLLIVVLGGGPDPGALEAIRDIDGAEQ